MARRFKDMETPEQQYAREATLRPHRPVGEPSHQEWRSMDAYEQAAHLARQDGREDEARKHEAVRAERLAPDKPEPWWRRSR